MNAKSTNKKRQHIIWVGSLVIGFLFNSIVYSQTIDEPVLTFGRACATPSFNNYTISTGVSSLTFAANNQFILELSDANGSFANPTQVATLPNPNPANGPAFDFTFSFPVDLRGDNFKLRVLSTNPVRQSPESNSFAYYYYSGPQISLNNYQSFVLCPGQQRTVTISPSNEPAYVWYKDLVPIPGETGPSLVISDPGVYSATVDLGACTINISNAISNSINVTSGTSGNVSIAGNITVNICEGTTHTFTSQNVLAGSDIQWFKDGLAVTSAGNNPSFTTNATNADGSYYFEVTNSPSGCDGSSDPVDLLYNSTFQVDQIAPATRLILSGQTEVLEVTTTATLPSIIWYRNGVAIPNSNSLSLSIGQEGSYYAEIIDLNGCPNPIESSVFQVVEPTSFSLSIQPQAGYVECQDTNVTLEVDEIIAITASNGNILLDSNIYSLFNFQWFENGTAITGANLISYETQSIPLFADFTLQISLNGNSYDSNVVNISLSNIDSGITTSSNSLCPGENVTIEVNNDSNNTYKWYLDGSELPGLITNQVIISEIGIYTCEISNGACSVVSSPITITEPDDSSITFFPGTEITINEGGSETIVASGADSYQWFDSNNSLVSTLPSLTVSQSGSYSVVSTIGGCEFTNIITVDTLSSGIIPNVITLNGDGINETWLLPDGYNADNITIKILDANGFQVLSTTNYSNDWPQTLNNQQLSNPVFYYIIIRDGKEIKKGTITVLQ